MKKLVLIVLLVSVYSSPGFAAKSKGVIAAKCYLELIGGGETINHFYLPATKSGKIDVAKISTLRVSTVEGQEKKPIYKVKECVKIDKKFKSSRAKNLEKAQVW